MPHPKLIGDRTTLAAMLALRAAGFGVLLPFGENARYDLVLDDGERLLRVQCKTGRLRDGAVQFKACSTYAHHPHPVTSSRDYHGQVDYFAIHCPQTAGVYLVPITDLAVRVKANLRVTPARNGQSKRIRLAETYKIGSVRVRPADSVGPAQPR